MLKLRHDEFAAYGTVGIKRETLGRHFAYNKISRMPGGCLLSFLLSIAGCGPIWLRQRLPWLRSVSRFGTGAPSSTLLSRFAVNKEKAFSFISRGTIPEHPFSLSLSRLCEGIRRNDSISRFHAISHNYFKLNSKKIHADHRKLRLREHKHFYFGENL